MFVYWFVDIVTSTLAFQKESIENNSTGQSTRRTEFNSVLSSQSLENNIIEDNRVKVYLPDGAPLTPLHGDCILNQNENLFENTPDRLSVVRCPTSIGGSCPQLNTQFVSPGTPSTALSWDHYTESPIFNSWQLPLGQTYIINNNVKKSTASSTDPHIIENSHSLSGIENLQSKKIPIVSTDCSDIENMAVLDPIKVKKARAELQTLQDELDDLDPASIGADFAPQLRPEIDKIWGMKNAFRNNVRDLVADLPADDPNRLEWESISKDMVDKVIKHKGQVLAVIEKFSSSQTMSEFQKKSLELQEKALLESQTVRKLQVESEKKVVWAEAKVRLEAFREYSNSLADNINADQSDVSTRDNLTISVNMQELDSWKKTFEKAVTNYREYVRIVTAHGEEDPAADVLATTKEEFTALKETFEERKEAIEKADRDRELFCLHKSTGEKLEYPRFSGAANEDFVKFKDKMVKAFRTNGVAKNEQVEKLRKVLSGFALALVPESTDSIDKAFETLKSAFGDPRKVLEDRMAKLKALGDLPSDRLAGNKPGFRKQEEWYLSIEALLSEIISLGQREEDLAYHAFSEQTFNFVLSLFPSDLADKLSDVSGSRIEQLKAVLVKLGSFRLRAQRLGKIYGDKAPPGSETNKVAASSASNKKSPTTAGVTAQPGRFFRSNERYEDCRVCRHMESEGKEGVFENHASTYPTGCPIFAAMPTSQRRAIAIKCNLCVQCLDPDIVWDQSHRSQCRVNKSKIKDYTCLSNKCKTHMWLCVFHHKRCNKEQMEKHKSNLQKKGISLSFVSLVLNTLDEGGALNNSVHVSPIQSIEEATRKLTNTERRLNSNKNLTVVPPPIGQPMFLFFQVKGKKHGANFFFDKGCSHACFKEGIPGGELTGEIISKGPFEIGGVGAIKTKANDEWLVSVETVEGKRQLIQGLTVDKVTADFPVVDIQIAASEVKRDRPTDRLLQSCQVPKHAGGVTHGLIGIKYELIHPDPIHTLPSGLTLYKSRLVGHSPGVNAMIGGPHSTFDFLSDSAGGVANMVANFVQGIEIFRKGKWTPPKVPYLSMSVEETMLAEKLNSGIGDMSVLSEHRVLDEIEERNFNGFLDNIDISDVETEQNLVNKSCSIDTHHLEIAKDKFITCNSCSQTIAFNDWLYDCHALPVDNEILDDVKIQKIKKNLQLFDSGLEVEYRCVKCRDCSQCKKADQSEKISIREEQEMQLIRDSIFLDWDNKKVVCSLPVRGEETDFLTSNRNRALRVLDQQCKRWFKDENKDNIIAAFEKLFKTGDTRFLEELTDEERSMFIDKPIQYFIPWRVVYNNSPTTPVRPVLDGSSITDRRTDGTGGRCLNDFVVKGKIETLNIVRLVLDFTLGLCVVTGDLSQFYYSFSLRPNQWNLQRFLWRDGLNPDNPVREGIIGALIYGIKSVSCQTETAMEYIADACEESLPNLAKFIRKCRYVDDMAKSDISLDELKILVNDADSLFAMIGLKCKGWIFSGEPPPNAVKLEGECVKVAGLRWMPEVDTIEVPVPDLHFAKKSRGKLPDNAKIFEGDFADLDSFVPQKLTRRNVASKLASLYDLLGKFTPILAGLKLDLRKVVKNTDGWDDQMPADLRNKWLENFWRCEQLKGIKFTRARMPIDALDKKMKLITLVDAAKDVIIVGIWTGFKRPGNIWSCQHLIGRALLADENSTIPKNELQALCGGANLSWIVKKSLDDWVEKSILVGDSEIALCWTTAENKPLSIFHKNRAVQIRRSVNLEDLYHVKTDSNPSDIGTRPEKVTVQDVGPGSRWENGDEWMTLDLVDALKQGYIKSAKSLRLSIDQEDDFKRGLTFEKVPELLTRGHPVNVKRLELLEERASFSKYIILPNKYSFPKVVRIISIVCAFVSKARKGQKMTGPFLTDVSVRFSVFTANYSSHSEFSDVHCDKSGSRIMNSSLVQYFANENYNLNQRHAFVETQTDLSVSGDDMVALTCDTYVNMALNYLYRKGTLEVKKFNKEKLIERVAVEKDGILLSRGRLLDQMNFKETADLPNLNLGSLGVKVNLPVLDRYSPLSYSIAEHVHWDLAKHKGVESCNRLSLENVSIIQGATLYKELGDNCIRCKIKRKKFLEVAMGPVSDSQLTLAPPCWMIQVDLFGPIMVKVPGFERQTRNRRVLEAECHIMTAVCPTTRLVNLQVLETTKSAGWIDAFTRLSCEVGVPSHVFMDQDSAGMSAFQLAEIEYRDLKLQLHRQKGISFNVCGVSGHDKHGHVERVIQSVQQGLEDSGLRQKHLHATGLQTLCKLVESQYNNLPLGYHYSRSADNTPMLKMITPNMLRIGRINSRSLDGPIKLPASRMDLLAKVEETYEAWYKLWLESLVPKLLFTPKWFKTDKELQPGDLVYFRKKESAIDGKWVIGKVESVRRGRDDIIREVDVKYFNGTNPVEQFTLRSVRKLVKIWNLEDMDLQEDLMELQRKFGDLPANLVNTEDEVVFVGSSFRQENSQIGSKKEKRMCQSCCCLAHHLLGLHFKGEKFKYYSSDNWDFNLSLFAFNFEDEDSQKHFGLEDLMLSVTFDMNT